eukprot:TRINITY_DN290_c13_g1_i2.p1 TRINITY_DN290_c13_g1~~TRINITY_DN290_c13_g1_i2.p1  ORF type:complete len:852 (+),score=150.12 TRINITY_DN290_c13_g1_i2:62-2557(+)
MSECARSCFGVGDDFLRQFEAQVEAEEKTWRARYADARGLLQACEAFRLRPKTTVLEEDEEACMPLTLLGTFKAACVGPQQHFDTQLAALDTHWESLRATLAAAEEKQRTLLAEDGYAVVAAESDSDSDDESPRAVGKELLSLLHRLVEEHYRGLLLLQVFQYWHRALYDRCLSDNTPLQSLLLRRAGRWWTSPQAMSFRTPKVVVERMNATIQAYRNFLAVCDPSWKFAPTVDEVESLLSRRRVATPPTRNEYLMFGSFVGFAACAVVFITLCLTSTPQAGFEADRDLWRVMPLFRGLLVVYVAVWLWGMVMLLMDERRVNYPYILGLTGENITAVHVFKIAGLLTACWMTCFGLYIADVRCGVTFGINPRWYPFVNIWFPIAVFVWPTAVLVPVSTRLWLLRTLAAVVATPFVPVTFAVNFLTDYLTSTVKVLNDFAYIACTVTYGGVLTPLQNDPCSRDTNPVMEAAALVCVLTPLTWRWLQCCRKNFVDPLLSHAPKKKPSQHSIEGTWYVVGTSSSYTIASRDDGALHLQLHTYTHPLSRTQSAAGVEYSCPYKSPDIAEGLLRLVPVQDGHGVASLRVLWRGEERLARRAVPSYIHPHGMNTLKYTLSILPGVLGLLHKDWGSSKNTDWPMGRVLFVFALCCSTVMSFYWDVFMDWGVIKREKFPQSSHVPVHRTLLPGWVWRHARLSRASLLGVILYDLLGRLAWAVTLVTDPRFIGVTGLGHGEMLFLVTATVEVTRRSLWALVRLGHEQQVDVGQYRAGDGYRNVPPLVSRKTPWTVPGELTLLQPLKVQPQQLADGLRGKAKFRDVVKTALWKKGTLTERS